MSVEQGLSSFLADRSQATCCADEDNHVDDNDDEAEDEEGEKRCLPFAGMRTKGWGGASSEQKIWAASFVRKPVFAKSCLVRGLRDPNLVCSHFCLTDVAKSGKCHQLY